MDPKALIFIVIIIIALIIGGFFISKNMKKGGLNNRYINENMIINIKQSLYKYKMNILNSQLTNDSRFKIFIVAFLFLLFLYIIHEIFEI